MNRMYSYKVSKFPIYQNLDLRLNSELYPVAMSFLVKNEATFNSNS
jgi:hypothetical protein